MGVREKCNIFLFPASSIMSLIDEKILLLKIRTRKDSSAYGEIYDKYIEAIYRFVYFKLGNREEAEDVASEVFLKAWQYLTDSNKREIRNIRALLYSIARNAVIDCYRQRAKHSTVDLERVSVSSGNDGELRESIEVSMEHEKVMMQVRKLKLPIQLSFQFPM